MPRPSGEFHNYRAPNREAALFVCVQTIASASPPVRRKKPRRLDMRVIVERAAAAVIGRTGDAVRPTIVAVRDR